MSLECIRLRSRRYNVGFADVKFWSVLDGNDPLLIWNEVGQNPHKGLSSQSLSLAKPAVGHDQPLNPESGRSDFQPPRPKSMS
jgi:hypothetical protein